MFVFCDSERGTLMFVSSTLRGVLLFFVFFAVRSSNCFVYCSSVQYLLPCSEFLFVVVRCLSACRLPLLFFSSRCPVHSCLFLFTWSLFISLVAYLASSLSLSSRLSLLPLSCSCLFFLLLLLAPVFCLIHFAPLFLRCGGSALCDFRISGFTQLFCSASAFTRYSFLCFVFSPRCLLLLTCWAPLLGFRFPYSLVGCSDVSWPPVDVLIGSWLCLFVFLFLLLCFLCVVLLPFSQRFLVLPCVFLGPCVVTCVSLLLVLPPLSDRLLLLGLCYLPCFFPLAASVA